jgi:hypothetical protein
MPPKAIPYDHTRRRIIARFPPVKKSIEDMLKTLNQIRDDYEEFLHAANSQPSPDSNEKIRIGVKDLYAMLQPMAIEYTIMSHKLTEAINAARETVPN